MPMLQFRGAFVPAIRAGTKRQTVRAKLGPGRGVRRLSARRTNVHRKLYEGNDGLTAKYELGPHDDGVKSSKAECYLRLFDVVGGDALVFLTPDKARRLVDDLEPFAAPKRGRR